MTSSVLLDFVWPITVVSGGIAIYYHFDSAAGSVKRSVDSKDPLRAAIAKHKTEEWIDKLENPLRAENSKPRYSISHEMKKMEQLCSRIDKVEVELMDTKLSIKELALDFKDQRLDMKRLLLQKKENFKK